MYLKISNKQLLIDWLVSLCFAADFYRCGIRHLSNRLPFLHTRFHSCDGNNQLSTLNKPTKMSKNRLVLFYDIILINHFTRLAIIVFYAVAKQRSDGLQKRSNNLVDF